MRKVKPRSQRRVAALFVASAAVLFTTACGGSSDEPAGTGDGGGSSGNGGNNAFTAYVECLSKNGVTMTMPSGAPAGGPPSGLPRPSGSEGPRGGGGLPGGGGMGKPEGVDDATWQKAQEACASLRPSGGPGGGPGGPGGGAGAAFENCLKDNGVTTTGGSLATDDPTVQKAIETCRVLQPSATPAS